MTGEVARRFWSRVALWDECWIWIGSKDQDGYGRLKLNGIWNRAHHLLLAERPTRGLCCDHLCRNRACVRPSHIEVVTIKENSMRGLGASALNAAKRACPDGHPYDAGRPNKRSCRRRTVRNSKAYRERQLVA